MRRVAAGAEQQADLMATRGTVTREATSKKQSATDRIVNDEVGETDGDGGQEGRCHIHIAARAVRTGNVHALTRRPCRR